MRILGRSTSFKRVAITVGLLGILAWLAFGKPGGFDPGTTSAGQDQSAALRRCVEAFNRSHRAPLDVLHEAVVRADPTCVVSFYDPGRKRQRDFVLEEQRWVRGVSPPSSDQPNAVADRQRRLDLLPGY